MIVELTGVEKTYPGQVKVLDDIHLAVESGEHLAVIGPSGSGKSTLLNILGLLDRPTAGSVVFDGQEVADWPDRRRADARSRSVGFVFQESHLLSGRSALENVQLGLTYASERLTSSQERQIAAVALERVGLSHRLEHHPNQLSGGEAQRVAVARAIVKRPLLLLCDEPTGNLDEGNTAAMMGILEGLLTSEAAQAVVVVTHDPLVADRADRRVTLADGAITGWR